MLARYPVSGIPGVLTILHTLIAPGFCALLDRETLLQEVMPAIEELVSDSSQHVRAALANNISGLAPILGKEEYVPTIS